MIFLCWIVCRNTVGIRANVKISTIRLITKNVKESDIFLNEVFDLSIIERQDSFTSYKLKDLVIDLILEDSKNPSSFGGAIIYFQVESLDNIINKVRGANGEVYRGPLVVSEVNKRILQIKGPAGIVLGFEESL